MIGFIVMGATLMVGGWHTRAQERPVAGWVTTTGTVVGVHHVAVKSGYVYGPIVSFTDSAGHIHQFTAPTSPDVPTVGAPATVSYDPRNPAKAHDLSDSGVSWAAPFITGIVIVSLGGFLLAFVGWLLIHKLRRNAQLGEVPHVASPRAAGPVSWIPRLTTLPVAVLLYLALQTSTHRWVLASAATAAYLVVTWTLFTYLAHVRSRRQAGDIEPEPAS